LLPEWWTHWYPKADLPVIPNLITIARLLLTPYIVLAILSHEFPQAFLALVAAGLTDGLDGFLARQCGWTSDLGAFLDPLADKVLLCSVFLALGFTGVVPMWLVYIVFGRDVLIALGALAAYLFTPLRNFRPSAWGKISTFLQIFTAVVAVASHAFWAEHAGAMLTLLVRLTTIAALWSCVHYYYRSIILIRRQNASGSLL